MENVMEAGAQWQLKLVRDIAGALENLEWVVEFGTQFPSAGNIQ
jgi:hypothetical protein